MNMYIVTSNYFTNGFWGVYTTVKRARIALEHFFAEDEDIVSFQDVGDYYYEFTTKIGETFGAEICWGLVDEEFVEGTCKEG